MPAPKSPSILIRWLPGPLGRGLHFLLGWFLAAPWLVKLILMLIVVGGLVSAGIYFVHTRSQGARLQAVREGWKEFDQAVRAGNEDGMQTALQRVLAADPGDPLAARRLKTLETGQADSSDPAMLFLTIRSHLRAGRIEDAEREADKQLAVSPIDWMARCVKAAAALQRGDSLSAGREIDALPDPATANARLDPGGIVFAFRLARATNRDLTALRTFTQVRVLAWLRTTAAQSLAAGEKLTLVECYLESFEPSSERPQPTSLVQGWSAADDLTTAALEEAERASDTVQLARIGQLSERLTAALNRFRQHEQITATQLQDLGREVENRARRAWKAVLAASPRNAKAYYGLAFSHLRSNEIKEAQQYLTEGLAKCEPDPELYRLFAKMLHVEGRALTAYYQLAEVASQPGKPPIWWTLAAEAAAVANRRDLALAAIAKARTTEPGNRVWLQVEARLWLEAGQAAKALELLKPLGEETLSRDIALAETYVRALANASPERVESFVDRVIAQATAGQSPMLAVAGLRGWISAPLGSVALENVIARSTAARSQWPSSLELLRVHALALYEAAAWLEPVWDARRVSAAADACESVRAQVPEDPVAALALGWLRLAGENQPAQALRAVAPLVNAENDPLRTVAELELLGAIFRANDRMADSLRVLERACESGSATAGSFIQLALTLHAAGRFDEARVALMNARTYPRTPREQAAYVSAVATLNP